MSPAEIRNLSLIEIAEAIRTKRVSSHEVTRTCLDAIEAAEPVLNAFISLDIEGALRQAEAADRALASGHQLGPLHGVPLAHKDMYFRAGVVTTCGARIRRHFRPEVTASALRRLEQAGALHLGGLNMAEFALGPTGHNDHFGDCHNPWDPTRITGGSSSGSGAVTAARLVYGALGSDTGGSVRHPAGYCGVVGIKPTAGRVSRAGALPLSPSLDCVGPLTRTVRDAARLLGLIAGPDRDDPTAASRAVPDYEAGLNRPIRGRRIGVLSEGYMFQHLPPASRAELERATQAFAELGCTLVDIPDPGFTKIAALASVVMRAETLGVHAPWLRTRAHDYSPQVRTRLLSGTALPAATYLEAMALRGPTLDAFCHTVFRHCDVLLAPVINGPAPKLSETAADDPSSLASRVIPIAHCTRPINYLGLPALSLPCGAIEGLPFGFQLIGRPFDEATLFHFGHAYQSATDHHMRAPQLV